MVGTKPFRLCSKIATLLLFCACFLSTGCRQWERPFVPEPVCPQKFDLNFDQCPCPKKCSDAEKCRLAARLERVGVETHRVGEDMKVVIPSDLLFLPHSANFNCRYQFVLPHIASLLECYRKEDVRIAGYTDCGGNPDHNKQLSVLQAEKVAKFLWHQGIDARLLYSKGFGALHPVARNQTYYGRSVNRRIEITFRDIPHPHKVRSY